MRRLLRRWGCGLLLLLLLFLRNKPSRLRSVGSLLARRGLLPPGGHRSEAFQCDAPGNALSCNASAGIERRLNSLIR